MPQRAAKQRRCNLGRMLVYYRAAHLCSLREMAVDIGLSAATLSRVERGYAMDAATMLKLWQWLLRED